MKRHILFLFILLPWTLKGQYTTTGLSLNEEVHNWYDQQVGLSNTLLTTGSYFQVVKKTKFNHPFFISDKWVQGDITYNGEHFSNISLLYDMENDFILIRHPETYKYIMQPIKPLQHLVSSFEMQGHYFMYYHERILLHSPGFFEVHYQGHSMDLLTKRVRRLETNSSMELEFVNKDSRIIRYKADYYKIKSRMLFYRLFKEHRKQLRKYIREHQVIFGNDNEERLAGFVEYCDSLID
ncbi:MAG: hypothetical protein OEX02_05875 [Cyclobacteriaceae bacterium]|nr:hypothetical protein [Cyclobacteriaceae bacterium]